MNASSPTSTKRPAPFSLRLNAEERDRLERAAGSMQLGAYIKSCIFAEDAPRYRKRRALPEADQFLLAQILARLGQSRTANNLNQIAKHLNQGTLIIDEELAEDLRQAIVDVAWMRTQLMEALGCRDGKDNPSKRSVEG